MENLKFKPNQRVVIAYVRNASAVGYLGLHMTIYDYEKHPEFFRRTTKGEILYPCMSDNGEFCWCYEDELK